MNRYFPLLLLLALWLSACLPAVLPDREPENGPIVIPTTQPPTTLPSDPTMTASATAAPPTAVPVTPTPPPPTPTSQGQFLDLYFSTSPFGLPQGFFPGGTEEVFAIWDYAGLADGDMVRRVWSWDGAEWLVREEAWDTIAYSSEGTIRDISVFDFEGSGLAPGTYQLTLYINGAVQTQQEFRILEDAALATSTETQVAWVEDGHILMLDAWDGDRQELARAHEIVELLWLPDARHLLYVDRRPPEDPAGPPWSKHALFLVDSETAIQHQLSTYEENLHRLDVSLGGRHIRSMPGTDFGDACMMDRQIGFLTLDETYQRVNYQDLRDFDSPVVGSPYGFFPEDAGKWVGEHAYEVNLTAFCLSADLGATEDDLALIGRYRFDLEAGTAVKVADS